MSGLYQILKHAVSHHPDVVAVVEGTRRLTYAQVGSRVQALAAYFTSRGIGRGDRVAIIDHNSLPFFESYFAAAAVGAVLCPVNTRLSPAEVHFILRDADPRLLLCGARFCTLLPPSSSEEVLLLGDPYERIVASGGGFTEVELNGRALAQLYYTSGTTGRPKGVMLTHDNVNIHASTAVAELTITAEDRWAHIAPMFHLADAWATFAVTLAGGRHVMLADFEAQGALRLLQDEEVTLSNLVPTMLNLMLKHPARTAYPCPALRLVLSGGAPISPDLVRRIMQQFQGAEYIQTYGLTETAPYLTLGKLTEQEGALSLEEQLCLRAKTGRPFAAVQLKAVAADGEPVPADGRTVGEILARGPTVTPGYWRRPEETRAAFTGRGWLRTGDLATLDARGFYDIVDRKKDMILSGGENVFSIEVENALYAHPAVLEVAVFGLPDETWGERVCAAVVLRPGRQATADELISHARKNLARYKAPRGIYFMEELPKTGTGKITKKELRERFGQPRPGPE